jgi:hypothetical protein
MRLSCRAAYRLHRRIQGPYSYFCQSGRLGLDSDIRAALRDEPASRVVLRHGGKAWLVAARRRARCRPGR